MIQRSSGLPSRFPLGSKYVIESRGFDNEGAQILHRYVEFPDGRIFNLPTRKALPPCASWQVGIVPDTDASAYCGPRRPQRVARAWV